MADEGAPAVLSLRKLIRWPQSVAPPVVRICENPAVLAAAADALGTACPPLVSLQGQPSATALAHLRHLHGNGSALYDHGVWGGLRIASALLNCGGWASSRAADATTAEHPEGAAVVGQDPGSRRPVCGVWGGPAHEVTVWCRVIRGHRASVRQSLAFDVRREVIG
ncbi:DUF2399 domain-containing protein [Streptomyces viridiviolaceus]